MPEAVTLAFALVILYSLVVVELVFVLLAIRSGARISPSAAMARVGGAMAGNAWLRARPCAWGRGSAGASRACRACACPAIREPLITDEFSYLLAADTFASDVSQSAASYVEASGRVFTFCSSPPICRCTSRRKG